MTVSSDVLLADKLVRRRARVSTVFAILFMTTQAQSLSRPTGGRLVDHVHIGAWVVWAVVLLVVLALGGGFIRTARVRALMNDESTIAHRQRAMVAGFWATVCASLSLYMLAQVVAMSAADAVRITLTAAVSAALLRFGQLERRALRGA